MTTPEERTATGKAARAEVPRRVHGEWEPASDRRDVVELLEEQGRTRVAELVPVRYGRMLVSPFTFFRGAAYPMAADLAGSPRTGLEVQLCGDAHLSNFGVFAAPDRRLVFSVNDFDETLPGPFEWDVKRLVASFRRRRPGPGLRGQAAQGDQHDGGARLPGGDEGLCRHGHPRCLVRPRARGRAPRAGHAAGHAGSGQAVREEHGQGAHEGQPQGLPEAHPGRRRQPADRQRSSARRPGRGAPGPGRAPPARGLHQRDSPLLPADAHGRPPPAARAFRVRPSRPQGRRRGERGHTRVDHAPPRPRWRRSPLPPVQGGGGVRSRAVPGQERVRQSRPAGGRGPAAHAGGERHPARLDPRHRHRRPEARLLHPPALGPEGIGPRRGHGREGAGGLRGALREDPRQGPRPLRGRDRDRRATSARATVSIVPSRPSRRPTPTRTNATTRPCPRPWRPAAWSPRPASELGYSPPNGGLHAGREEHDRDGHLRLGRPGFR